MFPLLHIGTLKIPTYGFCMVIGIGIAFLVSYSRLRKNGSSFDSLLLVVAVAIAVGLSFSKIFYYIFSYGFGRLLQEVISGDFSGFEEGGLVYYGGLLGGIVGAYIAMYVNKYDMDTYLNAIVPCLPLGHAFGRIGCLMAGCCHGFVYDGPLAVHSALSASQETYFPIQAVESLMNVFLFIFLIVYTKKQRNGMVTLCLYVSLYSIARFILEFFRGDLIRGIYLGLSTSQWISILLLVICAVLVMLQQKQTRRAQ